MIIEDNIIKVGIPIGFPHGIFSRWYTVAVPVFLLVVTTASSSQIDLSWTDDCEDEDGYSIERSSDGISWTEIDTVIADEISYSDTGLTAASKYYYRIRAYKDTIYTQYSNVDSDTTDAL